MAKKEGVKRLSITAAIVTPIVVFFAVGLSTNGNEGNLWPLAVFSLLCGFFAWGLIRLVAWVIDGFRRPSSEAKNKAPDSVL